MKVTPKQYAKLIIEMTKDLDESQVVAVLSKVAKEIKSNQDEKKLEVIVLELDRLYKEKEGILEGQVITAREITDEKLVDIKEVLAKKFSTDKEKVILHKIVDEKIKGGLIIKVGDEVWDGSVRARLEKLKSSLEK